MALRKWLRQRCDNSNLYFSPALHHLSSPAAVEITHKKSNFSLRLHPLRPLFLPAAAETRSWTQTGRVWR